MKLAGYTIREILYAVDETVVARAVSSHGKQVVLKYLDSTYPSPDLCARWEHEHAVLNAIKSEWVIRALALKQVDNSPLLVLEDFGSTNLAQLVDRGGIDMAERIAYSIQLVHALSAVHQHKLVHGDISSKNVLVDVAALQLKLCDFGLSTWLDREQNFGQDTVLRGTLEYMSPEQTGRTSLDIDYRSDFYSLGVTLYELFCGRTPFQSNDPMTLLHSQIAVMPMPLHERDATIPEPISRIVQKLLAKSPGDRYQSSFGLLGDLNACAQQWHRYRRIENFELATTDIPERFCLTHTLYGRDAETRAILDAFERVGDGRAELLLISGFSGIGKTALVGELHRPIVARRGYFARGKFDQYSRNQPYSALIQAFQQLLRQLSVEGEQRRHYWKAALSAALGENAAAIVQLLPDLESLIGKPAPMPTLPPAENENRFHIAFGQFVKALSSSIHPLVLFLDDLQWADASTLRLIDRLINVDSGLCVLIIGAYRDNEVDDHHALATTVRAIELRQGQIERLQLGNLQVEHVSQLIADTLHASSADVAPLAALCHEKTQGNPFFLGQFLSSLQQSGELHYARSVGGWRWNIEQIHRRGMTDNVVALMVEKLRGLPEATQSMLALAAHLGNNFDMRKLMAVSGREAVETAAALWPALQVGLVVPLDEHYKFTSNVSQLLASRYRFLHDRVQQAAYGLTAEHERPALQLRSGRLLLAASSEEELQVRLFTILEQLNPVLALIEDASERARLLELNIRGGMQAKSASAYPVAVRLLRRAKQLLTADAWHSRPEQTLLLYKELAEAEYLAGNFEQAESLYPEGIAASDDVIAQVTLCLVQADQYCIQGRFGDSLDVLLRALALLGREFPSTDAEAGALFPSEFESTERMLARYSHAELLQAPEATSAKVLLELRIYFALSHSTYQTGRFNAFVMVGCRLVQVSLNHGQSDLACIGYVAYVTAMSAMRKPYALCYRMGKLALSLAEQRENTYFRLTVYQYFPAFYQHWMEPLADSFAYLEKGIELGHSGINPLSAGFATLLCAVNKFVQGVALDELEVECEGGLKFLGQSHQPNTEAMLRFGILMPLQALQGKTLHRLSFDTEECRASEFFKGDFRTPSIPLALYSAAMIRHAYLMDDRTLWRQFSNNLDMIGVCLPDGPTWVEARFFSALGLLRFESTDAVERADNAQAVEAYLEQFKNWSSGCAENFHHKYLLIAAEQSRVAGDDRGAMDLYAQAIDAAKAAEFTACEALANELYARFWVAQNQRQLATNFVRDAYFHYQRWGAAAKCAALEDQWPQIAFRAVELRHSAVSRSTTHRNVSEKTGLLDLHSLLKANQVLAKEIQLDALLQKMIEVLLENAGAESAAIVLEEDDQLIIEAVGALQEGRRVSCQRVGQQLVDYQDENGPLLPAAIIEQARLTRSTLVLNNPAADERFSNNRYLRRRQPKSVMCLPVVSQGRLVAVLYLENNQLENAFTARHQVTLELLGAQAAISLVNARLYESMEEKIALRTEELRQMTLKDGLTGIANRRSLDERLGVEWRRASRSGQRLSLLLLDIDHFKQFNDHYGHLEGDQCIRSVAQMLQQVVGRPSDIVARYGGEEFAVLLPETDASAACRVAESCMRAIAGLSIPHAYSPTGPSLSVSIGVCTVRVEADMEPDTLIRQADQALYQAKREGRARYCFYSPKFDEALDRQAR